MKSKALTSSDNWLELVSLFPSNWAELALTTKAISRKSKNFFSLEDLMRTMLLHVSQGYSLRETVIKAQASGITKISAVALLKRLRNCEQWFKSLCHLMLEEIGINNTPFVEGIKFRAVDGSIVREPGKTGSQWRLHYAINLPDLSCHYFDLTSTKGLGTGESVEKIPIAPGDCIMADRGFCSMAQLAYVSSCKAYSLIRVSSNKLSLYSRTTNEALNFEQEASKLQAGDCQEWEVTFKNPNNKSQNIQGRLCVMRKTRAATDDAIKAIKKKAIEKQTKKIRPITLEYAKYIIVFTTLPAQKVSTNKVMQLYRVRWQIELVFKRFKSLAQLGHLPKYSDSSSRAWLYAKLFVCLLSEKIMRLGDAFSPWGNLLLSSKEQKSLA